MIRLTDIWESSDTAGLPFNALILQIIFFGAPHNGLNTDALSTLVGGQPSAPLIQDLTPGSGVLVNLNNKFAEYLARMGRDIRILSVVETRKTRTVVQVRRHETNLSSLSDQRISGCSKLTDLQHHDGSWSRDGPEILMVPKSSAVLGYGKETVLESDEDHSRIAKLYNSEGNVYYDVQQTIINCVKR